MTDILVSTDHRGRGALALDLSFSREAVPSRPTPFARKSRVSVAQRRPADRVPLHTYSTYNIHLCGEAIHVPAEQFLGASGPGIVARVTRDAQAPQIALAAVGTHAVRGGALVICLE